MGTPNVPSIVRAIKILSNSYNMGITVQNSAESVQEAVSLLLSDNKYRKMGDNCIRLNKDNRD